MKLNWALYLKQAMSEPRSLGDRTLLRVALQLGLRL